MDHVTIGFGALLIGGFSAFFAAMDYDWYMESRKARFLVAIIGRANARLFYIAVGVTFMVGGLLALLGIIGSSS